MRFRFTRCRPSSGAFLVLAAALLASSCQTGKLLDPWRCSDDECVERAKVCHNPSMMALARDLDHIEPLIAQVALLFGPEATNPPCPISAVGKVIFSRTEAPNVVLPTQPLSVTWLSAPQ